MSRPLKQVRLINGKKIDAVSCGPLHPPKGCTEACYSALTEKEACTCRCHGAYHGIGRINNRLVMQEKAI